MYMYMYMPRHIYSYCTAILLNGVSADVHSFRPASTALSTATKTGLSFAPELLLFLSFGSNLNVSGAHWITTLGYAKKTGSLQGMTGLDIPSGLATSATDTMYATNRVGGQMFNGSVSWMGELTSWTSDGYTITTRTSGTGDDDFVVLALGGADLSVVAGEITTPTATGNSDVTTTGIDPDAVFISLLTADSTGTIESSGSQAEGWCIGMAEGSTNYSHSVCNADNVGTTVCRSKASTTRPTCASA